MSIADLPVLLVTPAQFYDFCASEDFIARGTHPEMFEGHPESVLAVLVRPFRGWPPVRIAVANLARNNLLMHAASDALEYIQCTNGGGTPTGICGECNACMAYGRLRVAIDMVHP